METDSDSFGKTFNVNREVVRSKKEILIDIKEKHAHIIF